MNEIVKWVVEERYPGIPVGAVGPAKHFDTQQEALDYLGKMFLENPETRFVLDQITLINR